MASKSFKICNAGAGRPSASKIRTEHAIFTVGLCSCTRINRMPLQRANATHSLVKEWTVVTFTREIFQPHCSFGHIYHAVVRS